MLDTIKTWLTTQGLNLGSLILQAVIITVVGYLAIKLVMGLLAKMLEKTKLEKAAHSLILTLGKTVLFILLALMVASTLGIDVTGIVALASVVTLAVSLSLQNMLSNVVGGFTILYTHPFSSGDYVEIAGQSGSVLEIGMTYTKLNTPDNRIVSIPNSAVVSAEIVNYTVSGTRRVDIAVSASYDAPAEKVIEALLSCVPRDYLLEDTDAPFAALTGYGESSIQYMLRFWVKGEDYWTATFETNLKIKTAFDANGIEMTYPHLNVHLDK